MRDSTIFYRSFYEAIKELPAENQARIYSAIFEYSLNGVETGLSGLDRTVFTLVKPQLEANLKRYENGNKPKQKQNRSETEAKPKQEISETEANLKQDESKVEANKNDNVNDNVNQNVNANENENEKKGTKKFVPPSIDEVADYFFEKATDKKLGFEYSKIFAEKFIAHYTLKNWTYGNKKLKDWKMAIVSSWDGVDKWIAKEELKKTNNNGYNKPTPTVKRFTGGIDPPPPGTPFGKL